MPKEIQLWRVNHDRLKEMPEDRLNLERRLEDWLGEDVGLLGQKLLIIGRQVPTDYGGFIDLLCIDATGDLVIVELKRDRTPREVTAQILDYASWVADLSAERIFEISGLYLGGRGPLDAAFRAAFDEDLPEVLNESHKMLVVGSSIDPASERIIRYLSERHGLSINAITFQYFRSPSGEELIGRVHFLEPGQVDQKARSKGSSKRRRSLSLEELEAAAEQNGIVDLYRRAVATFQPLFDYTQTTRSSIRFAASFDDRTGGVLNLIPAQGVEGGLPFQLYTYRASHRFGPPPDQISSALPHGSERWEYEPGEDQWWKGHAGVFRTFEECLALRDALKSPVTTASAAESVRHPERLS